MLSDYVLFALLLPVACVLTIGDYIKRWMRSRNR